MNTPIEIEFGEVQSLLLTGYPERDGAVFLRLDVAPGATSAALCSLAALLNGNRISFGWPPDKKKEETPSPRAHIAFSAKGLRDLELDGELIESFPRAFLEGMPRRITTLGDHGPNHSSRWDWGGPRTGTPAALLLVYASDQAAAESHAAGLCNSMAGWQCEELPRPIRLRTRADPKQVFREHFGFVDGIANPRIAGVNVLDTRPENLIATGEFILGYPDESGAFPASPRIVPGGGRGTSLPAGDFGRNGSFLVARQLEQDVVGFWRFLLEIENQKPDEAVRTAAKMVGRWPNGAPLTRWRHFEPAGDRLHDDDFLYAGDPNGFGCPIGAHVRRANPRDAQPKLNPAESLASTRRRRLLRRGRPYGAPLDGWPDPKAIANAKEGKDRRGLHFLCFCTKIVDQFEFVQETWLNTRSFAGLEDDADPLLSQHVDPRGGLEGETGFTIQRQPLNRRIPELPRFVTVRGGGYFFLPGKSALRYIAGDATLSAAESDEATLEGQ